MKRNKKTKIFVFIALNLMALWAAVEIPVKELKVTLITLAQLNVAIAIGLGALSIGFLKNDKTKSSMAEITVAISILSLITFLIAQIDKFAIIYGGYLFINILIISGALILVLIETEYRE